MTNFSFQATTVFDDISVSMERENSGGGGIIDALKFQVILLCN